LSDLSDNQEILLCLLQIVSAVLSLTGSCVIVYKILRKIKRKEESTTPYERVILGLSGFDIASSVNFAVSPFLLPAKTSQRVWAMGTDATCAMIGFTAQFAGFWAVWYNAVLSFYFLLTVRFRVTPTEFARKYELWMHLPGAVFFPVTAFVGLWGGWYEEEALTLSCWIGDVPANCMADGVRCYTQLVAYVFGMIPTSIAFFSVIINNIVIYRFVRRTLIIAKKPRTTVRNSGNSNAEDNRSSADFDFEESGEFEEEKEEEEVGEESAGQRTLAERLTQEVATQGLLYVTAYLLTIVPAMLLSILDGLSVIDATDQGEFYPLLVFDSILLPLQGFFNVFIYVKPTYTRFRDKHPEMPARSVLNHALFDSDVPRLSAGGGASGGGGDNTASSSSSAAAKARNNNKASSSPRRKQRVGILNPIAESPDENENETPSSSS